MYIAYNWDKILTDALHREFDGENIDRQHISYTTKLLKNLDGLLA